MSKTKKCNFCNIRKKREKLYNISYFGEKKVIDIFICDNCNYQLDIV